MVLRRHAVVMLAVATLAYFALGVLFFDPMAFDEGSFNARAVTIWTTTWLAVCVLGGWALGTWGGACYGVLASALQFPIAFVAAGEWAPSDTALWFPITALASGLFGGLAGALATAYREARVRNAELRAKNAELERTTQALAQSEAMFRLFTETVPVGVWIWPTDPNARPYSNPAARRILDQDVGDDWRARILPEDMPGALAGEARLTSGHPSHIEYRILRGDGQVRWIRADSFVVREADGRIGTFVGVVDDITEAKQAEERRELIERRERLSALGTLVAGVAHEINNPLTYLKGNMELAQRELDRQKANDPHAARARKLLATSVEGADRIARIVKALRAVTRRSSEGEREVVRLNAVAANVHELMRTSVPATLTLEISLCREEPAIEGNPGELYQVLLNLATNAVQAIGPRRGRVTISTALVDGHGVISVRDDGPGIAPEVRTRLFTPFYTTKPEGTGLGLSLAHAIVHDHGGEIDVESRPGEGATFRVRVPLLDQVIPQVVR